MGKTTRRIGSPLFKRILLAELILLAATGVFRLHLIPKLEPAPPPVAEAVVSVRVQRVAPIPEMPDILLLPGVVKENYVVTVSAEVAGRVEKILPAEGDRVKEGDPLMRLNDDLLRAAYRRAKAQADFDALQLARIKRLSEGGSATGEEMDRAAAALAVSEAALAAAEAELERSRIACPANGVLNDLLVEPGEYVQPGHALAEIVDTDTVKVVVRVPEREVPYFQVGDAVRVLFDVRGEAREVRSSIAFISELGGAESRTTPFEIQVDNRDRLLHTERIVRVGLPRRVLRDVIMIPLEAVIPMEGGKAVYVVTDRRMELAWTRRLPEQLLMRPMEGVFPAGLGDELYTRVEGGKAERRAVTLGIYRGARVQVLDGLKAGDDLIVEGHRHVGPGERVKIVGAGDRDREAAAPDGAESPQVRAGGN